DGERFVHLDVLARLYAAAAKEALARIVAVKGIGRVNFIWFGLERIFLMLHREHLCRVMDDTIAVVIVADRTVKHVVLEQTVESLTLRGIGPGRLRFHLHTRRGRRGASPHQLPVDLDQAGVARLDGAELMMITDRRNIG